MARTLPLCSLMGLFLLIFSGVGRGLILSGTRLLSTVLLYLFFFIKFYLDRDYFTRGWKIYGPPILLVLEECYFCLHLWDILQMFFCFGCFLELLTLCLCGRRGMGGLAGGGRRHIFLTAHYGYVF